MPRQVPLLVREMIEGNPHTHGDMTWSLTYGSRVISPTLQFYARQEINGHSYDYGDIVDWHHLETSESARRAIVGCIERAENAFGRAYGRELDLLQQVAPIHLVSSPAAEAAMEQSLRPGQVLYGRSPVERDYTINELRELNRAGMQATTYSAFDARIAAKNRELKTITVVKRRQRKLP